MNHEKLKHMLPFLNTTGKRVRILREDLGYSQADLVKLLQEEGVHASQSSLSRCERDESGVDGQVIAGLAKIFGVSADYLLMLTDVPSIDNGDKEEEDNRLYNLKYEDLDTKNLALLQSLVNAFTELSPRDRSLLLGIADNMRQTNIPHIIGEDSAPDEGDD